MFVQKDLFPFEVEKRAITVPYVEGNFKWQDYCLKRILILDLGGVKCTMWIV